MQLVSDCRYQCLGVSPCQKVPSHPTSHRSELLKFSSHSPAAQFLGSLLWRAADLAQLKVGDGAGVDEGLCDDREAGVDVVRLVDVKDKLGVFQDVHPEPERKAMGWGQQRQCEPTLRVGQRGPEGRLALPLRSRGT